MLVWSWALLVLAFACLTVVVILEVQQRRQRRRDEPVRRAGLRICLQIAAPLLILVSSVLRHTVS